MLSKNLQITPEILFSFCLINNKKFLVLKKNTFTIFLLIPDIIYILKKDNQLILNCSNSNILQKKIIETQFNSFYLFLQSQLKKLKKPVIKCLLFKGLGLKINALTDKFIDLKLGYSHNIKINIPKNIKVTRIKNFLLIEGINAALVGNFAYFIKKKRLPDLYKGKGIFYKNETIKLKLIKKN
jgi:large subunit ribosomal protein L6